MNTAALQMDNEYLYSKQHTTASIKAMMPQLEPHVDKYIKLLTDHYNEPQSFTYMVKGVEKLWATKQARYIELSKIELDDIAWNTVVACIIKPTVSFTEVVGKIYKQFPHETDRQCLESASEFIAMLSKLPFINVEYPKENSTGVLKIKSNVKLTKEVQTYLDNQCFTLPSLTKPALVATNNDSGYETFKQSLILNGKYHEYPQNYAHINRANSVAFVLNSDVIRNIEPRFKEEDGESKLDRTKRYKQWKQLNIESIKAYVMFTDKVFYLSNAYCERGRTYARGHQINTQGDDYRKAAVELANKELIEI